MIYKVTIEDNTGERAALLSTNDKTLAETTRQEVNELLKGNPFKSRAIISLNSDEEDGRHVWWYDDNFSLEFLRKVWEAVASHDVNVEYC